MDFSSGQTYSKPCMKKVGVWENMYKKRRAAYAVRPAEDVLSGKSSLPLDIFPFPLYPYTWNRSADCLCLIRGKLVRTYYLRISSG